MDELKLMAALVALVDIFRKAQPRIDGLYVPVLAMALGAGLWWLHGLAAAGNLYAQGAVAGLAIVGGVTVVDRHATASAVTTAQIVAASVPPPPMPKSNEGR